MWNHSQKWKLCKILRIVIFLLLRHLGFLLIPRIFPRKFEPFWIIQYDLQWTRGTLRLSCIDFLRLQWLSELSLYLMTLFVCFVLLWRSCDQQVVQAMIKQKDCCVWIWTPLSAPLCHSWWWWSYWILIVKVWKMRTAYAVDVGTFLAKSWSRFFQLKYSSLPDFSILIGPSSSSV